MNFRNSLLEIIFNSFKWARNNTIEILEQAEQNNILSFTPKNSKFTFQSIAFQFQCIVTTTDTYLSKINKKQ